MGLFGNKNKAERDTELIRVLLTQEFKSNYKKNLASSEFNDLVFSLADGMKPMLGAMDQNVVQELINTLASVAKEEEYNELLDLSLALCWSRLTVMEKNPEYSHLVQNDILGTANSLLNGIHEQIKGKYKIYI